MGQMENEDMILCDGEGQSEAESLFTLNTNAVALVDPLQIQNYEFDQGDNVEYYAYLGTFEEANEGYAVALDNDFLEEDKSVDSYSAFCREADLKPHCSELELSLNEPKVLDANMIAQMTSTELTKRIQMHARALASLLRETNERTKLRQSLNNADEAAVAEFVAGSFRNNALCVHLQCGSTSS
ncbi:uncharacterized protein LOC123690517 [Pieris rapae]|uniref:uncharacterized protein LOC123690517 n=1 Tax=Pieris rapae TaxID=64459 RepID=UPI001E27FB99|nr:uncharacterized protein LOC123690517 [Pieris rapae]